MFNYMEEKPQINKIIFFDIDDTLVSASKYLFDVIDRSLKKTIENGFNEADLETLKKEYFEIYNNNKNADDHYEDLFSKYFDDDNKINFYSKIAKKARNEMKSKKYKNYRISKLKETLKALSEEYELGIITEGPKEKQLEKLKLLTISRFFPQENIWVTENKNDELYSKIFEKYTEEYPKENIWFIGDKEDKDIDPAKKAGFKTIRVSTGRHSTDIENSNADFIVHSVADLFKMKLE